ncbi:MAG: hydrogenase nickel incorporation protein HypB [Mariniphaga sp.]|nr:hydrogenase nickel incorporation protein HypB [Mariniphaga sp.]
MCDTCGCENNENIRIYKPGEKHQNEEDKIHDHVHHHNHQNGHYHEHHHTKEININADILGANKLLAERNRGYFEALEIFALNLVSSPGSGKTTLLEQTISIIGNELEFSVIEGDQNTANDAQRIQKTSAPVIQINTGQGCHLDAKMVNEATKKLDPPKGSILFIENVGNLVCPSMFDLGEAKRILIFSVTEGDDKPEKYPTMFHTSDVCIINKTDLLPYVDFDVEKAKHLALHLNPKMIFFEVSAKTGDGMEKWYDWLKSNS